MRKEIVGISLVFLVFFTLVSLLSYSPSDPSIHNVTATNQINNLFGQWGAQISGLLVGLFGLGAFWVPVIFLLSSIHFFSNHPFRIIFMTFTGGLLLIISTGSLFAVFSNHYFLFGNRFSSGGIIGCPLTALIVQFANRAGALTFFGFIWIIGFILATGFSLLIFIIMLKKAAFFSLKKLYDSYLYCLFRRQNRKKTGKQKKKGGNKRVTACNGIKIKESRTSPAETLSIAKQESSDFTCAEKGFQLPSINLLDDSESMHETEDHQKLLAQSKVLDKKLDDFGVKGKVVSVSPGPVITTYEYEPASGIKINKIVNLGDDLALALCAISIRIVAPIPGKAVVGIEVPNELRQVVPFKEVVADAAFQKTKSELTLCLGKDIIGNPVVTDLATMPHLLIAGATGTGKSVGLNTMICSLLYKLNPDELKFILVDPKRIELSMYDGIPHLITPVVTDVKKATNALFWAVREMEKRYELLSEEKAKNIRQYNRKIEVRQKAKEENIGEKLPYIVIIIDELADLMMIASRDVEVAITRLAQMARASGIHLILATQRPSVDVLTGIIKANFPTRLTFQVSSRIDSRTIIDTNGAENLLGNGDMLFLPPGTSKLQRIHGAYISEPEIVNLTDFLRNQMVPDYNTDITKTVGDEKTKSDDKDYDNRYDDAVALVSKTGQASISMIQRQLRIGYNRAARIVETMEKDGIVGPADGAKPRKVLVRGYDNID